MTKEGEKVRGGFPAGMCCKKFPSPLLQIFFVVKSRESHHVALKKITQNAFVSKSRGRLFSNLCPPSLQGAPCFYIFASGYTFNGRSISALVNSHQSRKHAWLVPKIKVQLSYVALKINTYRHLWMRLFRKNRAIVFSLKRLR